MMYDELAPCRASVCCNTECVSWPRITIEPRPVVPMMTMCEPRAQRWWRTTSPSRGEIGPPTERQREVTGKVAIEPGSQH